MAKSNNLHQAKETKNDEFYTQISDIEKELKHYKTHFKNKVVFCNCDDPEWSNFWLYFKLNFKQLELKKLISTHYHSENSTYKLEYDGCEELKTVLQQNGDFRNSECIEILKESDIVVTNPPFSLFREYVDTLMKHNKKFLIIGNKNAINYKVFFNFLKENAIWLGYSSPSNFRTPNGETHKINGLTRWFTNLYIEKRHELLETGFSISRTEYLKYENFDAININKVSEIPDDYFGIMGVPITFMDRYNPEQFELIGLGTGDSAKEVGIKKNYRGRTDLAYKINGVDRCPYGRILIKRKENFNEN